MDFLRERFHGGQFLEFLFLFGKNLTLCCVRLYVLHFYLRK